jgi:hypothetical protein
LVGKARKKRGGKGVGPTANRKKNDWANEEKKSRDESKKDRRRRRKGRRGRRRW